MGSGQIAVVLIGFALRLAPLGWHRFHQDEALYGYWAIQIAMGKDVWLKSAWVDKPPLYLYLLALAFRLFGVSEAAACIPNIFASTLTIALVYAWLRRAYNSDAALIGASLMAVMPFNILFAPTAFTDPLLVAFVVASMLLATRATPFGAGMCAGLALATKQQGLFFAPLSLVTAWMKRPRKDTPMLWAAGFIFPFLGMEWWDMLRWSSRPSFWDQSLTTYGGLRLIYSHEALPRLLDWLRLLAYIPGPPILGFLGMGTILLLGVHEGLLHKKDRATPTDFILFGFITAFLLTHWLIGFRIWDRYVLGLVPFLVALWARSLGILGEKLSPGRPTAPGLAMAALIAAFSPIYLSRLPIGRNYDVYDGIEQVAAYLKASAPLDAIIYHNQVGWPLRFYLYDASLEIRWYPSPEELARDATQRSHRPLLLVLTSWESEGRIRESLKDGGVGMELIYKAYRGSAIAFRVYRLILPQTTPARLRCPAGTRTSSSPGARSANCAIRPSG